MLVVEWVDTQLLSRTVELTRWYNPQAYTVPKHVKPYVERNLPVFDRDGMGGGERWTKKQVFSVVQEPLSVDTGCFVPCLVYAVIWYTHSVPFILPVWRLDAGASVSGERGALGGVVNGGSVESAARDVPALLYWPRRPGTLHGEAGLVRPAFMEDSPVSTVSPQLSAGGVRVEQGKKKLGRPWGAVIPGAAFCGLVHVDALLEIGEAPPEGWTVRSALPSLEKLYIGRNKIATNWRQEAH